MTIEKKIDFNKLQEIADEMKNRKIQKEYEYIHKKYPQKYDEEDYYHEQQQKDFYEAIKKFHESERAKNVCLLCGEEVPKHPMVCQDCKRVFAAFKSILVEEKELPKTE